MFIDAVVGWTRMRKPIEAAYALLEDIASNNYHWSSERASMKKVVMYVELMLYTFLLARSMLLHNSLIGLGSFLLLGVSYDDVGSGSYL